MLPEWERLRAQVLHGDFNLDNLLLDEHGRVTGILDFGDCCHTALAADVAVALASVLRGRPTEDAFRVARISLDGFTARFPLEPLERELMGDLVAARLAAIVSISAWRAQRYPENAAYIEAWDEDSWRLLQLLDGLDPAEVARELGAQRSPAREPGARAAAGRGARGAPDTADLHAPRPCGAGRGCLDLRAGRAAPPRRVQQRPSRRALPPPSDRGGRPPDTSRRDNARYLAEPLVELAERLVATFPADAGLDTVLLVNSGSEANDLAWRLAAGTSGRDGCARDRERLPRRHRCDERALAGGPAGGQTRPGRPHSAAGKRRRSRSAPWTRRSRSSQEVSRRRSSTER